jgi:hypothetical protein
VIRVAFNESAENIYHNLEPRTRLKPSVDTPLQHAVGDVCPSVQKLPQANFIEILNLQPVAAATVLSALPCTRQQIRNRLAPPTLGATQEGVQDLVAVAARPVTRCRRENLRA